MKQIGNIKSNAIYNPNEIRHPPPPNLMDAERDSDLEQYIRCECFLMQYRWRPIFFSVPAKYEYKSYLDRSALVASKLGPSRSASSVSTRPQPTLAPATGVKTASLSSTNSAQPVTPTPPVTITQSAQPRYLSQPLSVVTTPQLQPSTPQQPPQSGVWSDLISLQVSSTNSSLPLQFQTTHSQNALPSPQQQFLQQPGTNAYTGGNTPSMTPTNYRSQFGLSVAPSPTGIGMATPTNTYTSFPSNAYPSLQQSQYSQSFSPSTLSAPGGVPSFFQNQFQPQLQQPFAQPAQSYVPMQQQIQSPLPHGSPYHPSASPGFLPSTTPQLQPPSVQGSFVSSSPHSPFISSSPMPQFMSGPSQYSGGVQTAFPGGMQQQPQQYPVQWPPQGGYAAQGQQQWGGM